MPEKVLDSQKLRKLGWRPEVPLEEGLARTYRWFLETAPQAQRVA